MAKSNSTSQASQLPAAKARAGKTRATRANTGGWDVKKPASAKGRKSATPVTGGRRQGTPAASTNAAFSAVLKNVLATVPASARSGFVDVVSGSADGLNEELWGPGPTAAERNEVALTNLRRQFEARRDVVEHSLTRTEAAHLLGISEQAVLDRLEARDLLGLKKGREWRLPAWQFNPDSERGFVPGLPELSEVFPGGVVSMTAWAISPNVDLGGATPAAELAAGHVDAVVDVARVGTAAAW